MKADDPDSTTLTGREINLALKRLRLPVANVTDCIYTLMKRSPPHMLEAGRALGRKNWLHVGSAQAGPKVAAILSVVESCRRLGVPIKKYLAAILPGLSNRTLSKTAQLTPARWSASAAGTTE